MNPPGLEQLERAQGLAEKGPLTLALGLFVLLFVALFFWNALEARRNARELLKVSVAYQTSINGLTSKLEGVLASYGTAMAVLASRRRAPARKADPEAETARYQALPKEGASDALEQPQGEGVGAAKPREG